MQTVPFLWVPDIERSLRFYVDGLGFSVMREWRPEGQIQWAWLQRDGAAVMIQQRNLPTSESLGEGVEIYFVCEDALAVFRELQARGIGAKEPRVGNGMWEFGLEDPNGFKLHFESPTDVPEGTSLSETSH